MKLHDQRDTLAEAIKLALPLFSSGPTLQAFGIAREDCALAHIDYFGGIEMGRAVLVDALAALEGTSPAEAHKKYAPEGRACDCKSCAGEEASREARERHIAAYTNVKGWRVDPLRHEAPRPE